MHRVLLRDGPRRRLVWGADAGGTFRAKEYFERLEPATRAKFEPWFSRMADTGIIRNTEKFRQEEDDLFVFKADRHRLACFNDGRDLVLIHGFSKKDMRSRRSRRELETAARLRTQHLAISQEDPR